MKLKVSAATPTTIGKSAHSGWGSFSPAAEILPLSTVDKIPLPSSSPLPSSPESGGVEIDGNRWSSLTRAVATLRLAVL
ncbi:hypothetical protein VZT92_017886 [Zoarces viviparus]